MRSVPLLSLRIGAVAPLGPRAAPSGIAKSAVAGPLALSLTGFAGDRQGDPVRHGGPEKAVHHYPFEHYAGWARDLGGHPLLDGPGAFGENLSTSGLAEDTVAIGDVFRLGAALIEVSQGRQPCWKLNERFGRTDMARLVQSTGRTGWYYRVLEPGIVAPQESLVLEERRAPEWTLARIWRAFYVDTLNRAELSGIAALERLAEGWRNHARRRLESNRVEDWSKRLDGGA
ncbi:MOSC domain-containing protein [Shinella sp. PSBB067]|uniref:MOSC domain-containing protein n=1 Tax=Shinella sp. PSBB067 TaxID=2715959 RepID=UPI00193B9C27|nr:MOSC domain-containing protein [Shinella sp. PSBB067]QRI63955.1 MOSC domain-containing protein [Shinella sp. PSBB067]